MRQIDSKHIPSVNNVVGVTGSVVSGAVEVGAVNGIHDISYEKKGYGFLFIIGKVPHITPHGPVMVSSHQCHTAIEVRPFILHIV